MQILGLILGALVSSHFNSMQILCSALRREGKSGYAMTMGGRFR
jgi:hypothetical protein